MTCDNSCAVEQRPSSWRLAGPGVVLPVLCLLLAFLLAHGLLLGSFLHQGAPLAQPGDRLMLIFPPRTTVAEALQHVGHSGAALRGARGLPWFSTAEVVAPGAGTALGEAAWPLRLPRQATLASCFSMVAGQPE